MIDTATLREKVLDLAIRGKLVPQDPNDEPASVLLERIHEQKLQMVREGKLKAKDVKDDTIIFKGDDNCYYEKYSDGSVKNIQDEIPFDLPDTWSWVRLGFVFSHNTGKALKTSNTNGERLTYITTSNLYWDSFVLESLKEMYFTESEIEKYTIRKGDLLVCEGGDIGRAAIWTFDYDMRIQNHIHKLRAYYPIETKLYYYTFYYYKLIGKINGNGIGIQGLSSNVLHNLIVPLPPIQEQTRITATVNKCFLTADIIDENEKILQTDIEELKSKILELAIQGKLVPQDENDEPASILLERIRAERKAKLGKKYVESYIYKGDDNSYYENNDDNPIETPYDLPENWAFSRLEEVAWLEDAIKSSGEELPYLDVKTIRGKQNATMLSSGKIIEKGAQVILVDGENSGEVFEIPCRGYMGSTFRILQVSNLVEMDFIRLVLDYYKNLFKDNKTGSAIPHLNKKIFKSLIIGIPPIEEQRSIVNRVKSAMNILKDGV